MLLGNRELWKIARKSPERGQKRNLYKSWWIPGVMGRIKTTLTRRTGLMLVEKHKDMFKKDFEENKKIVNNLLNIPSKKQRNIVAGYVTRLVKMKK